VCVQNTGFYSRKNANLHKKEYFVMPKFVMKFKLIELFHSQPVHQASSCVLGSTGVAMVTDNF